MFCPLLSQLLTHFFFFFFRVKLFKKNVHIQVSILLVTCSFPYPELLQGTRPGWQTLRSPGTALPGGSQGPPCSQTQQKCSCLPFMCPLGCTDAHLPSTSLVSLPHSLSRLCLSKISLGCSFLLLHSLFLENLIHPTSSANAPMPMSLYVYQPRSLL